MNVKREYADFVAFRRSNRGLEFYLQKRDKEARINPSIFSLFGGSIQEGEGIQQAVQREIQEELRYVPRNLLYFSRFETATGVTHTFIEEVADDFESQVSVQEGQYGSFLTQGEIEYSPEVALLAQLVIRHLSKKLQK